MTYASQQDLINRFGERELIELTDRSASGLIDDSVVAVALSDADHEVDSYLYLRYDLPLSPVPPLLVRLGADIARYRLYDDAVSDEVRNRYEDAVALLKRLADGTVSLGVEQPAADNGEQVVSVMSESSSVWRRGPGGGIR